MSNASFPPSLPAPLADTSASYQPVSNAVRSSVDAGVAKQRRRFTNVARPFNCTLNCTQTQMATLINFYENTVLDVLPFDWIDFRTGVPATYRFIGRPQENYIAGSINRWAVAMTLEKLP